MPPKARPLDQRIMEKVIVDPETGCWNWQGRLYTSNNWPNGRYGEISVPTGRRRGRRVFVHRLSYTVFKGPIPEGLFVLHHCDNTRCCNPEHLFIGDHKANAADRKAKGRYKGNYYERRQAK